MVKKRKSNGINIQDICTGNVILVKEYAKDEKIPANNTVIGVNKSGKVACLQVRKIVFAMRGSLGIDLSSRLSKKNKYTYKIIDTTDAGYKELDVKNNTLVIDNPEKVGSLLSLTGFPDVVRGKNIKKITKLLLSSNQVLNIRRHSLKLDSDLFDVQRVNEANEQGKKLFWFKSSKLPTKPQEIEKVYKKHFK